MKVTALTFKSVDQIQSVTIQIKTNRSFSTFFPVVLFMMLYKVILTFKSVDEIVNCDHSNKGYFPVMLFELWCLHRK